MNADIGNILLGPQAPANKQKARRVYRKATICKLLDVSPGTVDNMVGDGLFVKPIKIGARCIGFVAEEVDAWLEQRIAERDAKEAKNKRLS